MVNCADTVQGVIEEKKIGKKRVVVFFYASLRPGYLHYVNERNEKKIYRTQFYPQAYEEIDGVSKMYFYTLCIEYFWQLLVIFF